MTLVVLFAFKTGWVAPEHLDPRGRGAQAGDVGLSEESIGYWQTVTFLHLLFAGTRWGSPSPSERCSRHLNISCTAGPKDWTGHWWLLPDWRDSRNGSFWGETNLQWTRSTSQAKSGQRGIIKSDESALTSPFIQAFPHFEASSSLGGRSQEMASLGLVPACILETFNCFLWHILPRHTITFLTKWAQPLN